MFINPQTLAAAPLLPGTRNRTDMAGWESHQQPALFYSTGLFVVKLYLGNARGTSICKKTTLFSDCKRQGGAPGKLSIASTPARLTHVDSRSTAEHIRLRRRGNVGKNARDIKKEE